MANKERLELEGTVIDAIKGGKFKVKLENGFETICTISGKMRVNSIKILIGDTVTVDLSPYDLTNGRITFRKKD